MLPRPGSRSSGTGGGSSRPANPPSRRRSAGGGSVCHTLAGRKALKITFKSLQLRSISGGIFDAPRKTLDVPVLVDMALMCELLAVA